MNKKKWCKSLHIVKSVLRVMDSRVSCRTSLNYIICIPEKIEHIFYPIFFSFFENVSEFQRLMRLAVDSWCHSATSLPTTRAYILLTRNVLTPNTPLGEFQKSNSFNKSFFHSEKPFFDVHPHENRIVREMVF